MATVTAEWHTVQAQGNEGDPSWGASYLVLGTALPVTDVRGHDPLRLLPQTGEAFQLRKKRPPLNVTALFTTKLFPQLPQNGY